MEEWKTIFNVNLTSAQADQPLLVEPLLIEEITDAQYDGYNLLQNADFNANVH